MKKFTKKVQRGFTLIELLVVIAIIGLLSSIVLASLKTARSKAKDSKKVQGLLQIRNALELFYSANKAYPLTDATDPQTTGMLSSCHMSGPFFGGSLSAPDNNQTWIPGLAPTYISVLPDGSSSNLPGVFDGCYFLHK